MTRDELIEAMARALDPYAWENEVLGAPAREYCLARARKSFAALETARPAIAAVLRGEAVVSQWQGIATAPKDGTIVDLWCRPYTGRADRITDVWWGPRGWRNGANDERVADLAKRATHWMPKPLAPTMIAAGEKEMGR